MKKSCSDCKLYYQNGKNMCDAGMWSIYHSSECIWYEPTLIARLKGYLRKKKGEQREIN